MCCRLRTSAAKRRHAVGMRCPMPPPNNDVPLPCPDALPKQHCTPKIIGMMCVSPGMPNKSGFGGYYQWLKKRIQVARQYGSRCNMDYFLLNKKGLEEVSIFLPKNSCNMHIARCNMHIAIESISPLQIHNIVQRCPQVYKKTIGHTIVNYYGKRMGPFPTDNF